MIKIILTIIILLFNAISVFAFENDKLIYENKVYELCDNLLTPLFTDENNKKYLKSNPPEYDDISWCNYNTIWQIENNKLFLRAINYDFQYGIDLKELFGEKCLEGKVFAIWYNGQLRIPDGKVLKYIQNNPSDFLYEKTVILKIESGKIIGKKVIENKDFDSTTKINPILSSTIDPDKSIFGIPFGLTEEEFIAQFGKPTKYIKFTNNEKEMVFGRKYAVFFKDNKLAGIKNVHLGGEVSEQRLAHEFDYIKWEFSNGIINMMELDNIKKKLGNNLKLSKDKWENDRYFFETKISNIELFFIYDSAKKIYYLSGFSLHLK